MVVHRTWDWTFFNNYSNHPRMCVLSTLCGNVVKNAVHLIYIYIHLLFSFWRSGTGKWFRIERRQIVFLWWDQDSMLGRVSRASNRHQIQYLIHDDVIKWEHFPRYWPFVRGIHRFPLNSPHKGQWRGALMFSLIWTNPNKLLSKQSWCWWFETPSHPLWRHRDAQTDWATVDQAIKLLTRIVAVYAHINI